MTTDLHKLDKAALFASFNDAPAAPAERTAAPAPSGPLHQLGRNELHRLAWAADDDLPNAPTAEASTPEPPEPEALEVEGTAADAAGDGADAGELAAE